MNQHSKKKENACKRLSENEFRLSRRKMKSYEKDLDEHPRLLPYQKDGVLLGVRLADLSPTWENCGFQNGDVVLEVNGSNIRSQRMLQTAYEASKESKALQIILQRKNTRLSLKIGLTDP